MLVLAADGKWGTIMKIAEMTFTVDSRGNIKIPAAVFSEMGLAPGDHVRVAYLAPDGVTNPFCEFMLLPDSVDGSGLMDNDTIRIPAQLMAQANISADADLQIACLNGGLLICRDTGLQPQELCGVLEGLQEAESLASMLPQEAQQALLQLEQTINTIQKGAEEDEQ